ncbi:hypothetical protein ANO14919_140700 [Xylariales sp. No.14919]|nr:hypothetical protein ANO14919_140700 [Xylariales sp. No.14919]
MSQLGITSPSPSPSTNTNNTMDANTLGYTHNIMSAIDALEKLWAAEEATRAGDGGGVESAAAQARIAEAERRLEDKVVLGEHYLKEVRKEKGRGAVYT